MARRPALALVRPDFGRRSVRLPSRRTLALCAGAALLAGLAYVGARTTPVFAVRNIEVSGGTARARTMVRRELERLSGRSLVAIDGGAIAGELGRLPSIRSASVDRAFPHDLRVVVAVERPVAVVHVGRDAWIVSARGRVIRVARPQSPRRLPVIRLEAGPRYRAGATVHDEGARRVIAALAALPPVFPVRVRSGRETNGEVTLLLASGTELRLGQPDAVGQKLRVAGRILASLPHAERASLAYLDVSVLARPVSAQNAQVVSEG